MDSTEIFLFFVAINITFSFISYFLLTFFAVKKEKKELLENSKLIKNTQ